MPREEEELVVRQATALAVREYWDDGVATAAVAGEIDISTVEVLHEQLRHLAAGNPRRLIIDLAEVSFVDSSGLVAFVRVRKALPANVPICIRSAQRRVRRIFRIAGLDMVFTFE